MIAETVHPDSPEAPGVVDPNRLYHQPIRGFAAFITGKNHSANSERYQDNAVINEDLGLVAVSDGMGRTAARIGSTESAGSEAVAQIMTEGFVKYWSAEVRKASSPQSSEDQQAAANWNPQKLMGEVIEKSYQDVERGKTKGSIQKKADSTITALAVGSKTATVGQIGDTFALRSRFGQLDTLAGGPQYDPHITSLLPNSVCRPSGGPGSKRETSRDVIEEYALAPDQETMFILLSDGVWDEFGAKLHEYTLRQAARAGNTLPAPGTPQRAAWLEKLEMTVFTDFAERISRLSTPAEVVNFLLEEVAGKNPGDDATAAVIVAPPATDSHTNSRGIATKPPRIMFLDVTRPKTSPQRPNQRQRLMYNGDRRSLVWESPLGEDATAIPGRTDTALGHAAMASSTTPSIRPPRPAVSRTR